jgi:homoserine kinase type II
MNSETWLVEADGRQFVAKAVAADRRRSFEAGLEIATLVEAAGIRAGAPVPTRAGRPTATVGNSVLALLQFVDGSELTGGSESERRTIGSTLGRVHLALAGKVVADAERFHWLDRSAPHLTTRAWLRPSIDGALEAWDALEPASLTWGPLHTDPAPEAFRLDDGSGECGLIDWDLGLIGPLLYDLASAQMYVGGPEESTPLIEAYLATGALRKQEVERGLDTLARMRWAVQADYFAKRVADDDLTGIDGPADNEKGLEDARRALAAYAP